MLSVMRSNPESIAAFGFALLALYCTIALLFTGGGRDVGGLVLLLLVGAIGGSAAAWCLFQRKPIGRWIGIGVCLIGATFYLIAALVSVRPSGDRILMIVIAAVNLLGAFALSRIDSRR
jgi:hypothetical protein